MNIYKTSLSILIREIPHFVRDDRILLGYFGKRRRFVKRIFFIGQFWYEPPPLPLANYLNYVIPNEVRDPLH